MSDEIVPVPGDWKKRAYVGAPDYAARYAESVKDPDGFWGKEASRLDWLKPFTKISDVSWDPAKLHVRWFED
ncbi:MAG TPA: acetyl-coenzyme A synthetase N-terminal domain-containing protein, partial [Rhizomicrobium sp.]|nr:acetyl-coenzyme A synthetase N-terminal domain-containing protein [Rhizomicrobium sp.]